MTPTGPLTESWDFSGSINRSTSQGQPISGTIGALVKFLSTSTLGDSIVTESGVTNTVGGNLRFGLTTQAGLRLNNLTTGQRDALTGGAGDAIWNTTTTRINVHDGASWTAGFVRLAGDTMTGALSIPGAGASSERFGASSLAAGTQSTAIGNAASASGNYSVAVGASAVASGAETVAIGTSCSFANSVAIGGSQTHRGASSVLIGRSANGLTASTSSYVGVGFGATVGGDGVAIGNSALVRPNQSVGIGKSVDIAQTETEAAVVGYLAGSNAGAVGGNQAVLGARATAAWRGVAVGWKATTEVVSGTAVGWGARSGNSHAIAIGRGAWEEGQNSVSIGFAGGDATINIWPGSLHDHKWVDWGSGTTITLVPANNVVIYHGPDAHDNTASAVADVAGGLTQIAGGASTGTAAGGSVEITTTPAGGVSNNTKNTAVAAGRFDSLATSAANESRFLLYDVQSATYRRIRFGASDSGGSGYRALIVPN